MIEIIQAASKAMLGHSTGKVTSAIHSAESKLMTKDVLDAARFGLSHIPLFALHPVFSKLITTLIKRHPDLFDRLGEYRTKRFLIDPVDLPFTLLLCPDETTPTLTPHKRHEAPPHDATILGPIEKFVDLINGVEDGDALFFSRDLRIEGDTEAVLALRNAIDDMEIDLVDEIDEMLGPLAAPVEFVRHRATDATNLFSGLKTVFSETFLHKTIDRTRPDSPSPDAGRKENI